MFYARTSQQRDERGVLEIDRLAVRRVADRQERAQRQVAVTGLDESVRLHGEELESTDNPGHRDIRKLHEHHPIHFDGEATPRSAL